MKSTQLQRHGKTLSLLLLVSLCLSLAGIQPVTAAPPTQHYYVDTTTDSNDPAYQVCDGLMDNSNCSLRGAITKANAYSGSTTDYHDIHLLAYTYPLTILGDNENANATGDLDTGNHYIIIEGVDMNSTYIDGTGLGDRIIDDSGTYGLKLMNLTVTKGSLASGRGGGGGIRSRNSPSLTLDNVKVYDNEVLGVLATDVGGGVYVENTHATLTSSTLSNNDACHGGGIHVADSSLTDLHLTNTGVVQNTARCGTGGGVHVADTTNVYLDQAGIGYNHAKRAAGYYQAEGVTSTWTYAVVYENTIDVGGAGAAGVEILGSASMSHTGIYQNHGLSGPGGLLLNTASTFTLTDSYLDHNEGTTAGAIQVSDNTSALLQRVSIVYNYADNGGGISVGTGSDLTLENVTLSHNEATANGGGLYIGSNNNSTVLDHVTIATNLGDTHGDAVYIANNGRWSSKNSIFYFPIAGDVCYYAGLYIRLSNGHNLINDNSCGFSAGTDMPNTEPLLGSLDYYGSDMLVRSLIYGSPAIDHALTSDPVSTDQRGKPRVDGNRDGTITSDIGAFEYQLPFFLPILFKP